MVYPLEQSVHAKRFCHYWILNLKPTEPYILRFVGDLLKKLGWYFFQDRLFITDVYHLCCAIVNPRGIIDEMIRTKETVRIPTYNMYCLKYVSRQVL